ncbi:Protein S-acyltransferase 8 [Glycine soja]
MILIDWRFNKDGGSAKLLVGSQSNNNNRDYSFNHSHANLKTNACSAASGAGELQLRRLPEILLWSELTVLGKAIMGRLIFGPDGKSIFLTIFLIVAPVAVFSAFVARNLLDDFPHHWGYSILIVVILHSVLITLLLTSGRDPGIVPRNANPPILDEYEGGANVNNEQTLRPHLPRAKEVVVNEVSVKIKY